MILYILIYIGLIREYYRNDFQNENSDKNLIFSSRISEGLVKVVQVLKIKPSFLVAKGGITSSDIILE